MKSKTILVVDDEATNLAAIRNILSDDYNLVFAKNGETALDMVSVHNPSLVLCDIQMPVMDGYEFSLALHTQSRPHKIPVIFVTSLNTEWDEEKGFNAGCVDYITKPVSPRLVKARVRAHLSHVHMSELEHSHQEAIHMLGAAGHHNDTDTGVHIWRMADYAQHLAHLYGWSKDDCELIKMAAPMHDTGKIGIHASILQKNGPLSDDEWVIMRTHPEIGYNILRRSDAPVFQMAAQISLEHHEKWNRKGYPQGLAGTDISESARIVAVADVFDALTTKRPYKDAWPIEKAVALIKEDAGSHFDPDVAQVFLDQLDDFIAIRDKWAKVDKDEFDVYDF